MQHDIPVTLDLFPTDVAGLPEVAAPKAFELAEGDSLELAIGPVANDLGEATVRMLAYGGSIPGPSLRVKQDSTVTIDVRNEGDLDATVHWHGLRLDNRYDGTHETQPPIPVGGQFSYQLTFPDPGIYWYHPHIRQDYGQEMGLYGTIVVEPKEPDYWPPADREVVLTVDDILVEEGQVTPFHRTETTFSAMGRYGNVFLVNGETDLSLSAQAGEVVRFYIVNTANSRVFNLAIPGAALKLVGGDSGRVEHETLVDSVILAPSERAVVDVRFEDAGRYELEHQTPERSYRLARLLVDNRPARNATHDQFSALRSAPELEAERAAIASYLSAAPDKTLALVAEMHLGTEVEIGTLCACPMHADIVASWADQCPRCGMKLLPAPQAAAELMTLACPMHAEVTASWEATCPKCGMTLRPRSGGDEAVPHEHDHGHEHSDGHGHDAAHSHEHGSGDGIEWEDDMLEVNRTTTTANTHWKIVDRDTGVAGHDISWQFRVGDRVKIRIVNEPDSDHPMHHPFHIHGAGRFLVLARDGVTQENLVWKDTVLLRMGETVDILLDVTNPGRWMAHCHIAEHHESGMMFSFDVLEEHGSPR